MDKGESKSGQGTGYWEGRGGISTKPPLHLRECAPVCQSTLPSVRPSVHPLLLQPFLQHELSPRCLLPGPAPMGGPRSPHVIGFLVGGGLSPWLVSVLAPSGKKGLGD